MSAEPKTETTEAEALRARIDALEREQHERTARANEALAAAQDRSYWLERWGLDLNALMQRRGAGEFRAALRAFRSLYRLRRPVEEFFRTFGTRLSIARQTVDEERALGAAPSSGRASRTLSPDPLPRGPVTDVLYGRLEPGDVAAVEQRLGPAESALWETAGPLDRRRLTLAFAAHYELDGALERTGLSSAMPDAGVHSMAHGAPAAGGSPYDADLVADALAETGFEPAPGQTLLDFGCSSGRVVRVLAAAYPEIEWHGCDPIPDAVEWARANLPGIRFERSPEYPPLSYGDAQFDAVFAISIWSHFAEQAALDWLREMRRVIRPGGRLLLTTHGEQTIVHTGNEAIRSDEQLAEVRHGLARDGFWYAAEFGDVGDHGVANPDWGTAFLSAEWLLAKLTPEWRVLLFRPGRVELNQDLYVLERV